ncbi:MAG: diphosphomevalonate decarboxylase [Saprospiraceae bacterium]
MPNNPMVAGWESPSNIALVKYWGKYGDQLPKNPSVSFTLSKAVTTTEVTMVRSDQHKDIELSFLFEGKENAAFASRIEKWLNKLVQDHLPFLRGSIIDVSTKNSFPHSSGIASSASGMSALSLCLCDLLYQTKEERDYDDDFYKQASFISRLGSGSACRSVYPEMAVWGGHDQIPHSSDEHAICIKDQIHPVFKTFHDDILIVSAQEKKVSSTAGHHLMNGNPYAPARYQQAHDRMTLLMSALHNGDVSTFGKITEDEAMTLHALMMCSDPPYMLMEEASLAIIKKIKTYRADTGVPIYFTLDAGPNIHVLYPEEFQSQTENFITSDLLPHCHEGRIIKDKVGNGPKKIK